MVIGGKSPSAHHNPKKKKRKKKAFGAAEGSWAQMRLIVSDRKDSSDSAGCTQIQRQVKNRLNAEKNKSIFKSHGSELKVQFWTTFILLFAPEVDVSTVLFSPLYKPHTAKHFCI